MPLHEAHDPSDQCEERSVASEHSFIVYDDSF
jgi:hypothetical protein